MHSCLRHYNAVWQSSNLKYQVLCLLVICIGLIIALVITVIQFDRSTKDGIYNTCGSSTGSDTVDELIDLREPEDPGPFHDLTRHEIQALRDFLEGDPNIKASRAEDARINTSAIFMMDLFMPKKSEVLRYLDGKAKQPGRQAIVIMFRGDLNVPRVEEYVCGPLPKVSHCRLLESTKRRNPIEFSLRPIGFLDTDAIKAELLPKIELEIGYILKESFGTSFLNCKPFECFATFISLVPTNVVNNINDKLCWVWAQYPVESPFLHPVGFGILLNISSSDPSSFSAIKVWYNGQFFESTAEFVRQYSSNTINKIKMAPPKYSKDIFSSMHFRGDPLPKKPQRPPTLVEPDGKRYTLKNKKVEYLGWGFNIRLSPLTGPAVFDISYKGTRIAYELSLQEISVYYSAHNPMHRLVDFVDSAALLGSNSKSLVPGGDCPETATFINQTFPAQVVTRSVEIKRAFCLFENNNGYPLRRHLSYSRAEGAFYNGMLDSALVLRSALTIANYDYLFDFIFHQNGVVEATIMSTGYILPSFFDTAERPYGFQIEESIVGNIHHHMFHLKADLDIGGTSNRYETLNIKTENVTLRTEPHSTYYQIRFDRQLKKSEKEALYKFNFDTPRYHVVHNNANRTKTGEIKAYSIGLRGMSKQLLPENEGNEGTIPWARHQLVVTKHKDDEVMSSSPYAATDSKDPVTDFSTFYADDEEIVDEDLVFWITQGMHHIPHSEDLPVTPTVGNHLTFAIHPYNYFNECPSMASRDQIRVELKDRSDPAKGATIDRNGNSYKQCVTPQVAKAYDQLIEENPDVVIESREFLGIT